LALQPVSASAATRSPKIPTRTSELDLLTGCMGRETMVASAGFRRRRGAGNEGDHKAKSGIDRG
jgi:hypothetical protein